MLLHSYLYWHDAGQDGDGDANGPTVTHKLEEDRCLEKELGDDDVCTSINLLLQVNQVFLVVRAARVSRWIAWHMQQY